MSDPIDDAVASAQPGIRKVNIGLGPNRGAMLVLPEDITEAELLGIVGMLALELPKQIRRDRNRALSRILVPAN